MATMQQHDIDLNDPIRSIGPNATATFDNSPSNPTENASSVNLNAATEDNENLDGEDQEDNLDDEDEDEDDHADEDTDED